MKKFPILKAHDTVEIIAPASRCSDQLLSEIIELLQSWKLNCIIDQNIFGKDLLCANTDDIRFDALQKALNRTETKAIICARGGYGSMRLIPSLTKMAPPASSKLFLGMSDITALNLYLQQQWQWPILHGALALDKFSADSIQILKSVLFGETQKLEFQGIPLNKQAEKSITLHSTVIGGNLCLVQTSIGTIWKMNGENKIIFLEEIGERGYRVDRMLEHLCQADIFKNAAAILLGDFINGNEPDGSSLVQPVLERFAQSCDIPVVQIEGIGHGPLNSPIPMGTDAKLTLGNKINLVFNG